MLFSLLSVSQVRAPHILLLVFSFKYKGKSIRTIRKCIQNVLFTIVRIDWFFCVGDTLSFIYDFEQ